MATFCSAAGKKRKVKETFAMMRMIRKTFRKDGYQQYCFLDNLVNLQSEIEAV